MVGDNVEQVWFGLCLIKAIFTLFAVSLVVLLCWRLLRSSRVRRRPPNHPMVHPLGTVNPTRKPADLDRAEAKRRFG